MDSICIQAGEYWWGGSTNSGISQPFSRDSVYEADFRRSASHQTMPLLLSSQGRYIWSESPFAMKIADGNIYIEGSEIVVAQCGNTLREAYLGAMRAHFPFSDQKLPGKFFAVPQYNTWMQFTYAPTQEGGCAMRMPCLTTVFPPASSSSMRGGTANMACGSLTVPNFRIPGRWSMNCIGLVSP